VGLMEIVNEVKTRVERDVAEGRDLLESKLPTLANLADKAAANPVIDAVLNAAHLSPDWFTSLAEVINKADAALAVADDARKAAEAAAVPAAPPAEPDPAIAQETAQAAAVPPQPDVIPVQS